MQVLLGLQTNALKFTQRGRVQTNVEIITTEENQKFLKISVIDTGIGIAKKNQDKLFKLFGFLQDDQNLNVNGIGLGLMISQLIVKKFDGSVTFDSQEGKGSTFCFTFKLETIERFEEDNLQRTQSMHMNQQDLFYKWKPTQRSIELYSSQLNPQVSYITDMLVEAKKEKNKFPQRILIVDD